MVDSLNNVRIDTMNEKTIISVIIPVYNTEKYLEQCILSVLNQNYITFEIILVDDGSTDASGVVCDEYKQKDNRVKVIHSQNEGLSAARNKGIKIAQGDYIMFLDSDDYMAENIIEKAVEVLSNNPEVDMLSCTYYELYPDGVSNLIVFEDNPTDVINTTKEHFDYIAQREKCFLTAWQNVFKRSVIEENSILFDERVRASEDLDYTIQFILVGHRFMAVNIPAVYYRCGRIGSLTTSLSSKSLLGMLTISKKKYEYFKENNEYKNMKYFFAKKFAKAIYRTHRSSTEGINDVLKYIKKNRYILQDVNEYPYNAAKMIWNVFGFYLGSKLIRSIKSITNKSVDL